MLSYYAQRPEPGSPWYVGFEQGLSWVCGLGLCSKAQQAGSHDRQASITGRESALLLVLPTALPAGTSHQSTGRAVHGAAAKCAHPCIR